MKTPNLYRRVPGLVAGVTLFLNCFLLTGCDLVMQPKTVFGPDLRQFPAVVLSANGSHDYTFDWDKTTIGGISVSKFEPKAKYWRLNVFRFSDGLQIGNNDGKFKPLETDRSEQFTDLKWDKLMRADLDLTDDPKSDENARTLSFIVLLHDE